MSCETVSGMYRAEVMTEARCIPSQGHDRGEVCTRAPYPGTHARVPMPGYTMPDHASGVQGGVPAPRRALDMALPAMEGMPSLGLRPRLVMYVVRYT